MKMKFTRQVRESLATEIKKLSTYGGIGVSLIGFYSNSGPVVFFGTCAWWIVCQAAAHVLLSIEDKD